MKLLRIAFWALAIAFLTDLLRLCWIVEAWSIFPIAALLLWFAAHRLRKAWRATRRRKPIGFIRPAGGNFPTTSKRSIR